MTDSDPAPAARLTANRLLRRAGVVVMLVVALAGLWRLLPPSAESVIWWMDRSLPHPPLVLWLSLTPAWVALHVPVLAAVLLAQVRAAARVACVSWALVPSALANVGGGLLCFEPFAIPLVYLLLTSGAVGVFETYIRGRPWKDSAVWAGNGVSALSLMNVALVMEASKGC